MQSIIHSETNKIPGHVAVIMDGNGRWARQRGLPRIAGHRQGVESVTRVVDACARKGVDFLSLFAFSSENWGRPHQEVDALMMLLLEYLESQRQKMIDNGIRLQVIGDMSRMTESVQQAIAAAIRETSGGSGLTLVLALSYGGRDEIVRAVGRILDQIRSGDLDPGQVDAETFAAHLDLADMPPADLMIRTSGEMRLSNFLLWQAAYTELYFTDVLWPDFSVDELDRAFDHYYQRRRRFGLTDEQLGSDLDDNPSLEADH
ncbi:MAG: isoprenyl transferase [Pelovirga sp.]